MATIFAIGVLFIPAFYSPEHSDLKPQNQKEIANFYHRDVISRDSRPSSEVEVYYGRPGIFNLEEMLKTYSVTVYPEDIVKVFPDPSFGLGSQITIYRATPIIVNDGGKRRVYRTLAKTIKDFFDEQNIKLGEEDKVEPSITSSVSKNLEINITRVSETKITENVDINFKTIRKEDSNLERGKTKVVSVGQKGQKVRVYKVRRENGKEVSRTLIEEKIKSLPQDQVVVYGTKVDVLGKGYATWYTKRLSMVAACNFLPKGTRIRVVNLANGKSVVVTVIGGGIQSSGIVVDLSYDAFSVLADPNQGVISVRLEKE